MTHCDHRLLDRLWDSFTSVTQATEAEPGGDGSKIPNSETIFLKQRPYRPESEKLCPGTR
jgi:hypothetical protein